MKSWRESASVIIAGKNRFTNSQTYDYQLLFLKRHEKSTFSGTYVFPGGVIESADADMKWKGLYENYGHNENSFKTLIPNSKNRPQIFLHRENELIREISLRITAIRETFEECGILLCNNHLKSALNSETTSFPISENDLIYWQKKVHSDANEFYNMCEKLQCYPNLWALHEWANWMTPTFMPKRSRFNVALFFTCLSKITKAKQDNEEISEALWATPEEAVKLKKALPPPQQYELRRIAKYKRADDLLKFADDQGKKGSELFLPVKVTLSNGSVHLLPGDSMYPEKVELHEYKIWDKSPLTIQQYRNLSKIRNRGEFFNDAAHEDDIAVSKL